MVAKTDGEAALLFFASVFSSWSLIVSSRNLNRLERTEGLWAADTAEPSPSDVIFDLDFLNEGELPCQPGNGEFSVWFAMASFGMELKLVLLC